MKLFLEADELGYESLDWVSDSMGYKYNLRDAMACRKRNANGGGGGLR